MSLIIGLPRDTDQWFSGRNCLHRASIELKRGFLARGSGMAARRVSLRVHGSEAGSNRRARQKIGAIAKASKMLIDIGGAIVVALFAWLTLSELPFAQAINNANPSFILQFELAIYFALWVRGTTFDVGMQENVYIGNPKFPWRPFLAAIFLILVGVTLLWASGNMKLFAAALNGFIAVDFIGWRFLARDVRSMIRQSKALYEREKDYFGLAQLDVVQNYILGNWHHPRFYSMAAIVALIDIVSFFDQLREATSRLVTFPFPQIFPNAISALLPVLAFFCFILVAETWIWRRRLVAKMSLSALEQIEKKYTIKPN
jgi:hypothetical protein